MSETTHRKRAPQTIAISADKMSKKRRTDVAPAVGSPSNSTTTTNSSTTSSTATTSSTTTSSTRSTKLPSACSSAKNSNKRGKQDPDRDVEEKPELPIRSRSTTTSSVVLARKPNRRCRPVLFKSCDDGGEKPEKEERGEKREPRKTRIKKKEKKNTPEEAADGGDSSNSDDAEPNDVHHKNTNTPKPKHKQPSSKPRARQSGTEEEAPDSQSHTQTTTEQEKPHKDGPGTHTPESTSAPSERELQEKQDEAYARQLAEVEQAAVVEEAQEAQARVAAFVQRLTQRPKLVFTQVEALSTETTSDTASHTSTQPAHNTQTAIERSARNLRTRSSFLPVRYFLGGPPGAQTGTLSRNLADLMDREISSEDYETLLQLDEKVPNRKGARKDEIASLKLVPAPAGSNQECSICLDTMEEGQMTRVLPCTHTFHHPCIDKWLLLNKTCPVCKTAISL